MTDRLVVNADLGDHLINRNIYGHFSEHLGRCIYGGLWVGPESDIHNTRGMRNDVVQALRDIDIPVLRWPGGCFADEYHWMDGIGPREQRPTMVNTHWGGVTEDNAFGTHEFFDLCDQLGCQPYVCGNVGSGTVQEMSQWVEYCTMDGVSPMSKLRAENGREEPWSLTYWGVGNENWGCGGHMRPEYYADLYRRYATYCRNYGENVLYKVACGANSENYEWTRVLMERTANQMQGLSLHYYTRVGDKALSNSATEFGEAEWLAIVKNAYQIETLLQRHGAIMDVYDPEKLVGLLVDEWGTWYQVEPGTNPGFLYQQNSLRDAIVAALHLNAFNNHCDRVQMANIAQTVNVLQAMVLTEGDQMVLTPSYHVFEMFKVHQNATLLPISLECSRYGPKEGDGSPMPAINVSASRDDAGCVHISLCNVDPNNDAALQIDLRGMAASEVSARILTADHMQAHNTFAAPEAVRPEALEGVTLADDGLQLVLPRMSVVVLEVA